MLYKNKDVSFNKIIVCFEKELQNQKQVLQELHATFWETSFVHADNLENGIGNFTNTASIYFVHTSSLHSIWLITHAWHQFIYYKCLNWRKETKQHGFICSRFIFSQQIRSFIYVNRIRPWHWTRKASTVSFGRRQWNCQFKSRSRSILFNSCWVRKEY